MFFILSKLLSFLFHPLSWVFLALVGALIWRNRRKKLLIAAVAILFVFGNGFLLHEVILLWEVPVKTDQELDHHEVAVVLGGYAYYSPENDRVTLRESGDRLFQGVRLLQAEYVDHLVLSGGSGYVLYPDLKESLYVGAFLDEIGIPKRKVWLESESRNTHENAAFTASLLADNGVADEPIVLITSAYHMRRAKACFEKQGMQVIAFPAEPMSGERMFTPDHLFLPSAEAFGIWNRLIHEWVGFVSYKFSGYI
jgi:uncharacterized SAM-binding protein YcdF (DUF218 family)